MALTKVTEGVRTLGTDEVLTANINDDAVTTAKINDGDVTTAKMATDPTNASNLSSGSVPLAQLGNIDNSSILNDIATLALHSAVQNNQAAYNLSNAFIDQFEDDSGIDVESGAIRDTTGEYMWAATSDAASIKFDGDATTWLDGSTQSTISTGDYTLEFYYKYIARGGVDRFVNLNTGVDDGGAISMGYSDTNSFNHFGGPSNTNWTVTGQPAEDTDWHYYTVTRTGTTLEYFFDGVSKGSDTAPAWGTSISGPWYVGRRKGSVSEMFDGYLDHMRLSNNIRYTDDFTPPTTKFVDDVNSIFIFEFDSNFTDDSGNSHTLTRNTGTEPSFDTSVYKIPSFAAGASGNYTSSTETASATVSKMGIVVLYTNTSGTATLDTDLIAQVSADGGSNYTSAPLTAAGTFSTGVNIAVSNDITISNTGTTPKYKISFANQSAGVKETRVNGVALLY